MSQRTKRRPQNASYKDQQQQGDDFIENDVNSDSSGKKGKKKCKITTKMVRSNEYGKRKKVKVNQIQQSYTPQAESRVMFIYKQLQTSDVEGILDAIEIQGDFSKYQCEQQDIYKDWFSQTQEFVLVDGLMKPISLRNTQVKYLRDFHSRIKDNHYWSMNSIVKDLHKLMGQTYLRCPNQNCYGYLANIWANIKLKIKPILENFEKIVQIDIEKLIAGGQEYKIQTSKWPLLPDKKDIRSYQELQDYEPNPNIEPFISQINSKLSTKKQPIKCKKDCVCFSLEKMGSFSYAQITWDSECPNRRNRVECVEHEDTEETCHNQLIMKKCYKVINNETGDVEETCCWGIDSYTRKNIMNCLSKQIDEKLKQEFISTKLMLAIHRKCENVKDHTDLRQACDYIILTSKFRETDYSRIDRKLAKQLKAAMRYDASFEGFRVHTKGFGLICINKEGIKNNSLIIPYLGEAYQPWRWYEKQDFIKKQMKEANQKDLLPDFYNIMLDMHRDDEKGVDFLFIDPINKGNYSSRLSHSCNPNCGTVTTISNGKYVIGMYAMRDIKFGEELTFDYCSFTESKAEQLQALCLCGQQKCKIYYLQLSNSKEYNGVLEKEHCFLTRNAILLKSCSQDTTNYQPLYSKYRIGSSILKDCPQWLANWVGYILKFIDDEKILYKQELDIKYTLSHEVSQWNEFTVNQNAEDRIQNLVFTLDKIKYFLLKTESNEPPLISLAEDQIVSELWKDYNCFSNSEHSLINEIYIFFHKQNLKKFTEIINIINNNCKKKSPNEQMLLTRIMFITLSHLLLQQDCQFHSEAFSLILHMMAFTYTYFRPCEYQGFQSPPIEELEWRKVGAFKKKFKSEGRTYSSQFVWGQLIGWFKQTVVAPQASLSQDRRGTLSYPSFGSFEKYGDKSYPFQQSKNEPNRQYFLEHLLEKPSYMWPPELASWSYKNSFKLYGTVMFEQFYSVELGPDFLGDVLSRHSNSMDEKIQIMVKYEFLKNNHSEDTVMRAFDLLKSHFGENKLSHKEFTLKRQKRTIQQYFNTQDNKRDIYFEKLRTQGRFGEADFLQRCSHFMSIEMNEMNETIK